MATVIGCFIWGNMEYNAVRAAAMIEEARGWFEKRIAVGYNQAKKKRSGKNECRDLVIKNFKKKEVSPKYRIEPKGL